MGTFAGIGRRTSAIRPFWKNNAFWIVVMPTSLVAVVFLLAMITQALAQ
jgi:hypothetical protein